MSYATCETCGTHFWRDPSESWKRTCLPCWQRKKKAEKLFSGANELDRLREENTMLRRFLGQPRAIPDDMLPRLIRLCHPDKHGNSEASNEATAWLLGQRGQA